MMVPTVFGFVRGGTEYDLAIKIRVTRYERVVIVFVVFIDRHRTRCRSNCTIRAVLPRQQAVVHRQCNMFFRFTTSRHRRSNSSISGMITGGLNRQSRRASRCAKLGTDMNLCRLSQV